MAESAAAFLLRYDIGRVAELLPIRYQRMQADAFTFFRGSAPLYYARFGNDPRLLACPSGWLCGDAHVENFGSYRGDNDLVYFDLNDFDEALCGPLLWDVGRLAVSVVLAGAHFGLTPAERQAGARELLSVYAAALATGKSYLLERATATGVVLHLLKHVAHRTPRTLLKGRALRRHGWHLHHSPTLIPLPSQEQAAVQDAVEAWRRAQDVPPTGPVLDVAQRVAGVGSLGVSRYAVLAEHLNPRKLPVLLDLKLALPAAPSRCGGAAKPPGWTSQAQRVVQAQTWLQAVPPALLQAMELRGQPFVLRALQPEADKLDFVNHKHGKAAFLAALPDFARLLAWAHLRAAGRRGAATPDALQAFGAAPAQWQAEVLHFATQAATQVRKDHREFRAAYWAGALFKSPALLAVS
ncbi:MAG: DUF2252 family protein [Hymenobacter sp.]